MKLVSGSILLLAAEQAFAHAHLTGFPNHDAAARVLIPAAMASLIVGGLLFLWGLLTETRSRSTGISA
jgi:hypothetical protein